MFSTDSKDQKLDWMYKTPNSMVDREEYLLGRTVDKTLEQLNDEEKRKQCSIVLPQPKNHVEHECIPPSIREYNMQVDEQVDLSAKLKEDPLVAIRKCEEETRRQFLQNPVQLKKLQKALRAQEMKKKKRKKHKKSEEDLDRKIREKLELLKGGVKGKKKNSSLDTVLMHKFNSLKDKLSESDLQNILQGKISNSETSDSDTDTNENQKRNDRHRKSKPKDDEDVKRKRNRKYSTSSSSSSEDAHTPPKPKPSHRTHEPNPKKTHKNDERRKTSERSSKTKHKSDSDSDDSAPRGSWGLVRSDGKKIALKGKHSREEEVSKKRAPETSVSVKEVHKKREKLSEEEKEKRRREMMQNAEWREVERARNVKYYREKDAKDSSKQDFNPDFMRKELLKSANNSTVESRIKANINKIQRSGSVMNAHFSRRH